MQIVDFDAKEMYLGRIVSLAAYHQSELRHRIAKAWCAFAKFCETLCSRAYSLEVRVKLFESVVTPTALYGASCWTMTQEMVHSLRSTRRRMLRKLFGVRRKQDEEWHEYVQRATHVVEDHCAQLGYENWEVLQRKRKWKLAGRMAQSADGRWGFKLLNWKPWFRHLPWRSVGRPCLRWDDDIVHLAGDDWPETAKDAALWSMLEEGFARAM